MSDGATSTARPARARTIFATAVVIVTVLLVWKVIDYRMQPPPPVNSVSGSRTR